MKATMRYIPTKVLAVKARQSEQERRSVEYDALWDALTLLRDRCGFPLHPEKSQMEQQVIAAIKGRILVLREELGVFE